MTLPNKLTLSRLWMTPLIFVVWFICFHLGLGGKPGSILLWVLFFAGEITDLLDGRIARSRNLVSDVGKLMDPFSDVFLRLTYFLCFTMAGFMPVWALALILWRELGILFVRMLLVREGFALAAGKGGKIKAVLYFISGIFGLLLLTVGAWWPQWRGLDVLGRLAGALFAAAAVAALVSFVDYFRRFKASETWQKFLSE